MENIEKVKKGLAICRYNFECKSCPYEDERHCVTCLNTDAISVIAELEGRIAGLKERIATSQAPFRDNGERRCLLCGNVDFAATGDIVCRIHQRAVGVDESCESFSPKGDSE